MVSSSVRQLEDSRTVKCRLQLKLLSDNQWCYVEQDGSLRPEISMLTAGATEAGPAAETPPTKRKVGKSSREPCFPPQREGSKQN